MLNLYEIEHFIQPGTLAGLGWSEELHDNRPALRFATASGPRWRYGDGEKPKYDQNVGYAACWYGLRRAVANARLWGLDAIVDCNGAASTIAADQHRVAAFSLQSGEGTRPRPELIDQLKAEWSGRVIVAFDCDAAGRAGAIKRVQAYREAGIDAEAVDLGLDLDGGDLADFVGAGKLLTACNRLTIPQAVKVAPKQYDRASFAGWTAALDEIKQRLSCYDFMLQRYGEPKKRGQKHGHWLAVQRPEDTASFCAYMGAGGWYDYGPGEGGDIFDLIELVESCSFTEAVRLAAGLANVSLPERDIITNDVTAPTIISTYNGGPDWTRGLNIGERGALNRYAPPGVAAVIDLWAGSGNAAEAVDAEFLLCLSDEENRGLTERQIRSALNRLPVVFLTIHAGIKDSIREENISNALIDSYCLRELSERKIGRPSQLYALADRASVREYILKIAVPKIIKECFPKKDNALPLAPPIHAAFLEELGLDADEAAARAKELEARYGAELRSQPGWRSAMQDVRRKVNALKEQLQDARYAALPDAAPLEKRPNVLAAAARALIALFGGAFQMAQDRICALIGCRKNELASVCRNAGIVVDHHVYAVRSVLTHPALLAIPIKFDPTIGGFPVDVKSTHDDHPMGIRSPRLAAWALKQLRSMATLTVRYQMTNCYKLAEPAVAVVETSEPTIKQDLKVDPKPVQQTLVGLDAPRDTFRPWLHARLRFGLIAHVLNALVMAWGVAKEVAWYIAQHADHIVKYGEAVVNKLVDLARPWQRVGDLVVDPATGETKPKGVQLSFDLLLETKSPEESLELSPGVGSMENTEPCRSLPSKSSGSTIGTGSALAPPTTTPALAISLSP